MNLWRKIKSLVKPEDVDVYSAEKWSEDWSPPMWFIKINRAKWNGENHRYDFKEVEGFFVLQQDLYALYDRMGYLNQEFFEECGIPEFGIPWFEERYGKITEGTK
jgi:hypothetical protein